MVLVLDAPSSVHILVTDRVTGSTMSAIFGQLTDGEGPAVLGPGGLTGSHWA